MVSRLVSVQGPNCTSHFQLFEKRRHTFITIYVNTHTHTRGPSPPASSGVSCGSPRPPPGPPHPPTLPFFERCSRCCFLLTGRRMKTTSWAQLLLWRHVVLDSDQNFRLICSHIFKSVFALVQFFPTNDKNTFQKTDFFSSLFHSLLPGSVSELAELTDTDE